MARSLDPIAVKVGELLSELRIEKRLSVFEMASMIGIEVTTLIAIEAGVERATSDILIRVCALFEVPVTIIPGPGRKPN